MDLTNAHLRRTRRIAVLRALQLGDMLCAVPALRALRMAAPWARISLIGLPWSGEFAGRFSSYVDEHIEFPGWPGLPEREPDLAAIPPFISEMRGREFDLTIQMQGDGAITNPIVALFGARATAGSFGDEAWYPDDGHFTPYPQHLPERMRALKLVQALGAMPQGDHLEFPVTDGDRVELALLPEFTRLETAPYVCIHPGARAVARRWPPVYFAAVADALADEGFTIVLTGSESERAMTDEVAAAMERESIDLTGRTSLGALGALIEGSALVLCNDTGVSHMADALRVPSVVIFTQSDPRRWAPSDRWIHRIVRHPQTLDTHDVLTHALDLLNRTPTYAS